MYHLHIEVTARAREVEQFGVSPSKVDAKLIPSWTDGRGVGITS
jgi:hypothetical protein